MEYPDRNNCPIISKIETINYLHPSEIRLDNGIEATCFSSESSGIIQLSIIFNAGLEYSNISMLPIFSNSLLKEAPKGMSPDKFSELIDFYGCNLKGFVSNKYAGLKLLIPFNHFEKILDYVSKLLISPSLPNKELKILRENNFERIKLSLTKNKFLAVKHLSNLMFGCKNPFGIIPKPEDVYSFNKEDIVNFIYNNYNSLACKIIIAGEITDKEVSLLNKHLGSSVWGSLNNNKPIHNNVVTENKKTRFIYKPESSQSSILMGAFINPEKDDDIFEINILNSVLGGYFGSRLMKNIREDKGYTYGIGSFLTKFGDKTVLRIAVDASNIYTNNTIEEIKKEINRLSQELISTEELQLVKNYMLGDLLNSFNGVFNTANSYQGLRENNYDLTYIDKQVKKIKNIKPDTIRRVSNNYLNIEDFYTVVCGKEKVQ